MEIMSLVGLCTISCSKLSSNLSYKSNANLQLELSFVLLIHIINKIIIKKYQTPIIFIIGYATLSSNILNMLY